MNRILSRLIFLFLLTTTAVLFSQTKEHTWQFSFGFNAVDTFPTDVANQGALFEEFLNVADHWNIAPYPSQIGISNHMGSGFSFGFRLSFNSISKYGNITANNDFFVAIDGLVKYDLNTLFKTNRFAPFIETGGGYVFFGEISAGYFNLGFGIEYALGQKKKTVLFVESLFRNTGEIYGIKHFQHSVGLAFNFGRNDRDEDGIINRKDNCPDTPGLEEFDGCPDSDADGIEDSQDDCPTVYGLTSFQGCPDSDGDGIKDSEDACPHEAGLAAFMGCPDTDGDGIEDALDECPEIVGTIANNGCPEVTQEIIEELKEIGESIYFETDSDELFENDKEIITRVYEILKEYSNYKVEVHGHADSQGTDEYNIVLSESRAQSVVDYLIFRGISRDRIYARGYGERSPVESNSSEQGRALNRRVEFKLIKD